MIRSGALEGIRNPDRSVRSRLLYPAELQVQPNENKSSGALEGIRTPDRSVRSRLLYPAELQVHPICKFVAKLYHLKFKCKVLINFNLNLSGG